MCRQQRIGRTLERHPFSGLVDSAGELLHTPCAGFDFHDHRPAVWINQHLFDYLMSVHSGPATLLSVHPASPVLLTKNGPLGTHQIQDSEVLQLKQAPGDPTFTDLKFENRSRPFRPQVPLIIRFTR